MTHHSGLLGHWLSGAAFLLITTVGSSVFADEGGHAPLITKGYVRVCADPDNLPFSREQGSTLSSITSRGEEHENQRDERR